MSNWPSAFTFLLGFAGPLWVTGTSIRFVTTVGYLSTLMDSPIAGYDGPIHMSEEASNATTAVPIAIISSLAMAIVLGFGEHD